MNYAIWIRWRVYDRARRAREAVAMKIAWLLPRRIAMWCAVRVAWVAVAENDDRVARGEKVPEVTAMEAIARWEV